MKKLIYWIVPSIALAALISCNGAGENGTSTSTTSTDSSKMSADNTVTNPPASTDTANMNPGTNSNTTSSTNKMSGKKKGKVTTTMMSASDVANQSGTTTASKSNAATDKSGYYSSVEVLPTYPGGQSALDQFVNDNVTYPDQAIDANKEGTVVVHFGIDENGKVTNAKVTSAPIGMGLEEEALKVINKMPSWTPGTVKGKKVKSYYSLPIRFTLE